MSKDSKIIFLFLVLLVFFVAVLLIRLITTNQLIKQEQEYLSGDPASSQTLSEPTLKVSDPARGAKNGSVNIFVFEDFTCAYCAQMSNTLKQVAEKFPAKVRIIWKDFADFSNSVSLKSAVAARCAQAQGKFWEFHDVLFANQDKLNNNFYVQTASSLNLNQNSFEQCLANQETAGLVQDSFNEGLALGIDGTPYLFVNDQRISGAASLEELEAIINGL